MKPREYCCCAIPIVYAGIYTSIIEQFVLGMAAGTLSIGTPSIVGAVTPSFAKVVFAVICYVGAAIQVLGFIGVRGERPILYRRYVTLHILITVAGFAVAAAWIGLSATKHKEAQTRCLSDFFANAPPNNNSEGDLLCDIFPWADIGIMGGLWVVLAISQFYLCLIVSSYGKAQRIDHNKYTSLYESSQSLNNIAMADRAAAWEERRTSSDNLVQSGGQHGRQDSVASVATVMADKMQTYSDQPNYNAYTDQPRYNPYNAYPPQPGYAHTQDPGPTPRAYDDYYGATVRADSDPNYPNYPARSQPHPGTS